MSLTSKSFELFAFLRVHSRLFLLGFCGALIVVLWLLQWTPYLNVANDAGRYMVLGESLARTGDLRLINDARQPLDTLYPPGFPVMIAFWMRVTGQGASGVILTVKLTQLGLLLATLPLLLTLLERARLPFRTISVALIAYAACPALISYANEVMSEMPLLFLCLASVVLAGGKREKEKGESTGYETDEDAEDCSIQKPQLRGKMDGIRPSPFLLSPFSFFLSLLCAALAFLMRTSGIALLLAQTVWFWRRYGWKWGMLAVLVSLVVVGGWLRRNAHIIRAHPEIHYATYVDQFTLRDPMRANAGRIALNVPGLLSRLKFGLPTYVGLVPRALLHMMAAPRSVWLGVFYTLAVPIMLLICAGLRVVWRRGLYLEAGFSVLFWFVAAIWPWQNARFLVPLLPFLFLFLFLGVEWASGRVRPIVGATMLRGVQITGFLLLLVYFADVHWRLIHQDHKPALPGYAFGRSGDEAGFYAACAWLKNNTDPRDVVMGKPQYLLHLYTGNFTRQLEPTTNASNFEKAYIVPGHVRYLLQDTWTWGVPRSRDIFAPYLRLYGDKWTLAWSDPNGSGVRIWKRKDTEQDEAAKSAK